MTVSDAELTASLLATRDPDAFGELVRRHQALVRNMLARMTSDRAAADDIAQDAFVHAFERLDQFRGKGSFKSWLCRIAYTKLVDATRRQASNRRLLSAWRDVGEESVSTDPGDALDLERALAQLKEAERDCVVLCYACGFSHGEAAAVTGMPVGTVKSHVLRGRQKLEELLTSAKRTDDE